MSSTYEQGAYYIRMYNFFTISNTVRHTHMYDGCLQWIHIQVIVNNNVSEIDDKGQTTT